MDAATPPKERVPYEKGSMNRWTRRATMYGFSAIVLGVLYTLLKSDAWSNHDLLLCLGSIAAVASLSGFFIKPSEEVNRRLERLGAPATSRGRKIESGIWLASGLALIGAAFLISH